MNVCYSDSEHRRFKVDFSSPFLPVIYDLNLGFTFGDDGFIFMLQIFHRLFGGDSVLLSLPFSSFVDVPCLLSIFLFHGFVASPSAGLLWSLVVSAVLSYV